MSTAPTISMFSVKDSAFPQVRKEAKAPSLVHTLTNIEIRKKKLELSFFLNKIAYLR